MIKNVIIILIFASHNADFLIIIFNVFIFSFIYLKYFYYNYVCVIKFRIGDADEKIDIFFTQIMYD